MAGRHSTLYVRAWVAFWNFGSTICLLNISVSSTTITGYTGIIHLKTSNYFRSPTFDWRRNIQCYLVARLPVNPTIMNIADDVYELRNTVAIEEPLYNLQMEYFDLLIIRLQSYLPTVTLESKDRKKLQQWWMSAGEIGRRDRKFKIRSNSDTCEVSLFSNFTQYACDGLCAHTDRSTTHCIDACTL